MSVKERIDEYLKTRGITGYKFEKTIGKAKGWWGSCKNPTSENLVLMLRAYPEISAEWLLKGKGGMLISDDGCQLEVISDGRERYYQELVKMKDNRIFALEKELAELKSRIHTA